MGTPNLPDSWRQPTNSLQNYAPLDPAKLQALTIAAKRLFSQFKTDATVDPKTYLVAVIELLSHYPDDIVMNVTHPFYGMASRQNWLPTIAEIRKACDQASAPPERSTADAVAETLARREQDMPKSCEENRVAHVARLHAEGKLTFDGGPEADLRKPWWQRLTPSEARNVLNELNPDGLKELGL